MPVSLELTNANSGLSVPLPPPRRSTDTVRPGTAGSTSSITQAHAHALTEAEQQELDSREFPEQVELLNTWLQKAVRIRDGAENLLSATSTANVNGGGTRAKMIETELTAAKDRIRLLRELREKLAEGAKEKGMLSHILFI
jgi:rapamycin-insensitive companion of mTOR